jgi:DNA helicase II / ATP-dependent DNA helicase PcrA
MNDETTGHDGLFVVHPEHVGAYMERYQPMCLRHSASSARTIQLPFINFGIAKGRSANRVLIAPTAPIANFLETGKQLDDLAACSLYVAVTRARASVAFVSDRGEKLGLPVWAP